MPPRVLYIEDEDKQRESLVEALSDRGIEIHQSASGRAGIQLLKDTPVDVILCDVNMPEMDGIEVLAEAQRIAPDIPFVLLTGHPTVSRAMDAMKQGAYRFLIKPVHVDEIDITVRMAIEHARLQRWKNEAEEQLRHIVETTPVPMMMSRLDDGTIVFANRHFADLVGVDNEALKGRSTKDFYADAGEREAIVEELNERGRVTGAELQVKRADGNTAFILYSLVVTEVGGEKVILGGFTDITLRKDAEDRLRTFRAMFEQSIDVIVVWDADNRVVARNPAHERTTGYTDEEFLGQKAETILGVKETRRIRDAVDERGHFRGEITVPAKDGRRVPVDLSVFPLSNEQGETDRFVSMGRDLSDVKRALKELAEAHDELRRTQAQLIQSEKMASLGSLVAGIAHEINTPVGAVGSMHNTLVRAVEKLTNHLQSTHGEKFDGDEKLKSLLEVIDSANEVIQSGTNRVGEIVRRLRSFARLDEAELKKVDIHEGLDDTLTLIHHEIKHYIAIEKDFGDLPEIAVYPSRLNQVFLNLVNNARQAIEGKGTIRIETKALADQVEVRVIDTGKGIEASHLSKVFDPGFTTKGAGVGTGLGLSICYQIVGDHHGSLHVESEPGKGSTFILRLPKNLDEILEIS